MQNNMAMISPIMSGVISTGSRRTGLYWIVGNVYQIAQQAFINLFILKKQKQKIADGAITLIHKNNQGKEAGVR